jgi:hypothetical protein
MIKVFINNKIFFLPIPRRSLDFQVSLTKADIVSSAVVEDIINVMFEDWDNSLYETEREAA